MPARNADPLAKDFAHANKALMSPDGDKAEAYAAKMRTLPYTFVASHKGHNNE
jgi:hypothetical protein